VAAVEEIPPIMVLEENTGLRIVFRFRNRLWGTITLAAGLAIMGAFGGYQLRHNNWAWQVGLFYLFGLLLLYGSVYSFTADQFLVVNGADRSIRFHKKNLYGRVDWERPGGQFKEIHVFRARASRGRTKNWSIRLVGGDGTELFLGENEFGSFSREGAIELAGNVSRLTGIQVHAEES
jgi:hypothetical protein